MSGTEADNWREIAVYFADVLAATAQDFAMKKRTPRCETERQRSICETALKSLRAGCLMSRYRARDQADVERRLENALADATTAAPREDVK